MKVNKTVSPISARFVFPQAFAEGATLPSGVIARSTKFGLGDVVMHRHLQIRGVIVDVDPDFDNTEEWYNSIPEHFRPRKDQPFYTVVGETDSSYYNVYVSEQNIELDDSESPIHHPMLDRFFQRLGVAKFELRQEMIN